MQRMACAVQFQVRSCLVSCTSPPLGTPTICELETRHQLLHIVSESSEFDAWISEGQGSSGIVREGSSLHLPVFTLENASNIRGGDVQRVG